MEPRSCDRGKFRDEVLSALLECRFNGAAIMSSRKATLATMGCTCLCWLQWSRDHVIAERIELITEDSFEVKLQWSRDHVIAESRRSGRPRRLGFFASMEPRSCDRGKSRCRRGQDSQRGRFNGAAIM